MPLKGLRQDPQGEVQALVNHGRWIAKCPNPGCGGALVVSAQDPIFLCTDCGSEENGGRSYTVRFPDEKEAVERELMKRPVVARKATNRNWLPGETVDKLRDENRAHGVKD